MRIWFGMTSLDCSGWQVAINLPAAVKSQPVWVPLRLSASSGRKT